MSHDDFEPIPGLPEKLPPGERVLWQGAPQWQRLAIEAFHVRKIAAYFLLLACWQVSSTVHDGGSWAEAIKAASWMIVLMLSALFLLLALARFSAQTTLYTITNARIVMRFGMALPLVVNIPFRIIESADWRMLARQSAEICLSLDHSDGGRLSWAHLWPHAKAWHLKHPKPMLRALADGEQVAALLAQALSNHALSQEVSSNPARPLRVRVNEAQLQTGAA
ncbi:MAG: PH domain-containing protein [Betaproteobacteria bacterium]|nr:PH domain-containing protein [Pseudomonadota bacterium]NCW01399.1 PH domain-containing protein [Betaproteobacteria bacterium]NCW18058.1 PH domain-containing protein [Betaproteobacteria bacterium]NCX44666.1 PH domain-containing protein [Betaproteobacteria bacterium]NDA04881.1 PH domain-containing protein [Betaproteobacteria bacterium]